MANHYSLFIIEDDNSFSGSLGQALSKHNQFPKPVKIQSFSYQEYEQKFTGHRNSSREIIVFGGRENLNFEPDTSLLQLLASKYDRTHFFVLTPLLESKRLLHIWHPCVSGVTERNESAKSWLAQAINRVQRRQRSRSTQETQPKSFLKRLKTVLS